MLIWSVIGDAQRYDLQSPTSTRHIQSKAKPRKLQLRYDPYHLLLLLLLLHELNLTSIQSTPTTSKTITTRTRNSIHAPPKLQRSHHVPSPNDHPRNLSPRHKQLLRLPLRLIHARSIQVAIPKHPIRRLRPI